MIVLAVLVVLLALLGYSLLVRSVRDADMLMLFGGLILWVAAALIGYPVLIWLIEKAS